MTTKNKKECPLGKVKINVSDKSIVQKCVTTITGHPQRTYFETVEGDFKQRYLNQKMSFTNKSHANDTSLSENKEGI